RHRHQAGHVSPPLQGQPGCRHVCSRDEAVASAEVGGRLMTDTFDWNQVKVREVTRGTGKRKDDFLLIKDLAWAKRAFEAVGSKHQFACAPLIYRHSLERGGVKKDVVAAVRTIARDWGISHDAGSRTIQRLKAAGLIEAGRNGSGSSYRVKLLPTRSRKGA